VGCCSALLKFALICCPAANVSCYGCFASTVMFPTVFYWKLAAASFVVRACGTLILIAAVLRCCLIALSTMQVGGFMEIFMIKTGFYDM
jgi:hypothetical protein